MSEDLLRQIAAELNKAPGSAERASRIAALVVDNNTRIASYRVLDAAELN